MVRQRDSMTRTSNLSITSDACALQVTQWRACHQYKVVRHRTVYSHIHPDKCIVTTHFYTVPQNEPKDFSTYDLYSSSHRGMYRNPINETHRQEQVFFDVNYSEYWLLLMQIMLDSTYCHNIFNILFVLCVWCTVNLIRLNPCIIFI